VGLKGRLADVIYSPESGLADPDQRYLASYFLKRADRTMRCFPGLDTIQKDTKLSRKRVVRAIARLEAATGPVRIQVRRGCRKDGPGRTVNVYTLLIDLSAAEALKSSAKQSAPMALRLPSSKAPDLSADLSVKSTVPECRNGRDLSADVDPGSLSGNSLNELSQVVKPRARAPVFKKMTQGQREEEELRARDEARTRQLERLAQWVRDNPDANDPPSKEG
jgi:hypothetical protein